MDEEPGGPRMLVGFMVASVAAVLVALGMYELLWQIGLTPTHASIHSSDAITSLGLGFAFVAVILTTAVGAPVVVWLGRRSRLTLAALAAAGAAAGAAPALFALALATAGNAVAGRLSSESERNWIASAASAGVIGLAAGVGAAAIFWVIAVRGRTVRFSA